MSGRPPDLAFVIPAVEHLPEECRYHGKKILDRDVRFSRNHVMHHDGTHVAPCCGEGEGAFLRYFAAHELGLPTIEAEVR